MLRLEIGQKFWISNYQYFADTCRYEKLWKKIDVKRKGIFKKNTIFWSENDVIMSRLTLKCNLTVQIDVNFGCNQEINAIFQKMQLLIFPWRCDRSVVQKCILTSQIEEEWQIDVIFGFLKSIFCKNSGKTQLLIVSEFVMKTDQKYF